MDSPVRVLSHLPDVLAICLPAGNEDLVPTVLPDLQHSPVLPDLGDLADHHAAAGLPHLLALPAAAEPLQAALPEHRGGVEVLGGGAELGARSAAAPDQHSVPAVGLVALLASTGGGNLVAVKLHGGQLERISRELPAVLVQRLAAEQGSLARVAKLDETVLVVDHGDDDPGLVGHDLDPGLLADADQVGGVLLELELLLQLSKPEGAVQVPAALRLP